MVLFTKSNISQEFTVSKQIHVSEWVWGVKLFPLVVWGSHAFRTVTSVYISDTRPPKSNRGWAVWSKQLGVWVALSHTRRQTDTHKTRWLFAWLSQRLIRQSEEDKKQLSIQNSVITDRLAPHTHTHTQMQITYRQMAERNVNLAQEIISSLKEKNKVTLRSLF